MSQVYQLCVTFLQVMEGLMEVCVFLQVRKDVVDLSAGGALYLLPGDGCCDGAMCLSPGKERGSKSLNWWSCMSASR